MSVVTIARQRVSDILAETLYDNPVVIKAFRTRMRGWKAFVMMGGYVAVMAIVLLITYYSVSEFNYRYGYRQSMGVDLSIGKSLFTALTWAQAFLLTLIIPALSASAITHELEKKTIEMLALTPLSAGKIVVGKQVSDFIYTLILLACSAPLAGICLMLGGVSPMEIWVTYLLLVAWVYVLSCTGVLWSSLCKKTAAASGNSFGLSLLYFIATLALPSAIMISSHFTHRGYGTFPFMLLNPAYASAGALQKVMVCGIGVSMSLIAIVLHVALGTMFLLTATTHIKYRVVERALPIRLLLIGITVLVMWLAAGSAASALDKGSIAVPGIVLMAMAMIGAAIFATGPVTKSAKQGMHDYAFSLRHAFRSDIGGAMGFIMLWTALAYGTYGLAALVRIGSAAMPIQVERGFWKSYFAIGVSILAIAAATAAIGVMASSMTRKRATAAAVVVLFILVAFTGFAVISSNWTSGVSKPSAAVLQLASLWPLTPVLSAAGIWKLKADPLLAPAWLDHAWLVTSIVYSVIGVIALALASSAFKKTGGVVMEE